MSNTYKLCKKLLSVGRVETVNKYIDIYLMNNRLTEEEYNELMSFINTNEEEK